MKSIRRKGSDSKFTSFARYLSYYPPNEDEVSEESIEPINEENLVKKIIESTSEDENKTNNADTPAVNAEAEGSKASSKPKKSNKKVSVGDISTIIPPLNPFDTLEKMMPIHKKKSRLKDLEED